MIPLVPEVAADLMVGDIYTVTYDRSVVITALDPATREGTLARGTREVQADGWAQTLVAEQAVDALPGAQRWEAWHAQADVLGDKVWDALVDAGIQPYHATGDGFDILKHQDDTGHVVVITRRDGALSGTGRSVTRQMLGNWIPALRDAGFVVELFEHDGDPYGLVVALDESALRHGVDLTLACAAATAGAR
ncbi:hypothetical protein AB0B89_31060 [Sphaerisporangium sp. NPDC049002]|uniref:hypothetical protein n=1 Tax=Sphaerisporangium sp. NPDC049002 TaxID=3155392 RepID=UPI00340E6C7E